MMIIEQNKIEALRALLKIEGQQGAQPKATEALDIVLLAHTNPDGDALGSTLAWRRILTNMGHRVNVVAPNKYPSFLGGMPHVEEVLIYRDDELGIVDKIIEGAHLIFCMDFNSTSRLEGLGECIEGNQTACKILIDHHLSPDEGFDLAFSHPESSSTCFLVYSIVEKMLGAEAIDATTAELIYVGLMTDTGNFSFANLTPELFEAVAGLVRTGIDVPAINNYVYNSYSEHRARLFGYVVNRKMVTIHKGQVAYMSLTENELRRHKFAQGDSEGFVNFPLSIKKMKISAIFVEHRKFIRASFRSRGDVDVNTFARRFFSGGGHKNAAGGKSFQTMEQTLAHFERSVAEYAAEGQI